MPGWLLTEIIIMKKRIKVIVIILISLLVVWLAVGATDYYRVGHLFEKPVFARAAETADDGGSGFYRGWGYAFVIEGDFMPEDEFPGVTRYDYYIFGSLAQSAIRD